jgi:hypothetical protein
MLYDRKTDILWPIIKKMIIIFGINLILFFSCFALIFVSSFLWIFPTILFAIPSLYFLKDNVYGKWKRFVEFFFGTVLVFWTSILFSYHQVIFLGEWKRPPPLYKIKKLKIYVFFCFNKCNTFSKCYVNLSVFKEEEEVCLWKEDT